jgi:alpha-D-xyloside xylohydrolase
METAPGANPDPNYSHTVRDADVGRIIVDVPVAAGVDVYLFARPDVLNAVKRYNIFSGGGFVPSEWGLGFWYRNAARYAAGSARHCERAARS